MGDDQDESIVKNLSTVISGGALVSASRIVGLLFGFLTQLFLARILSTTNYGEVVLIFAVVNIAVLTSKMGMDDGITRNIAHFEDEGEKPIRIAHAGLILATLSSVLCSIILFLVSPVLIRNFFENSSSLIALQIGAVGIPFIVITRIAIAITRGTRKAKPHAYVNQIINPLSRFCFISILLLTGFGLIGAVIGQTLAVVVTGISAIWFVRDSLTSMLQVPKPMFRTLLSYSIPLIAAQGIRYINSNVDTYMIGYYTTSSSIGLYNVAFRLGDLLTAITVTAGFLLPPVLSRIQKEGTPAELKSIYQTTTKWISLISIIPFTFFFFAPEQILSVIFGSAYTRAAHALQILVLGNMIAIIIGPNGRALIALGNNRVISYISFIQLVINVILNIILIPKYGFLGAATAMTIGQIAGDMLGGAVAYRIHGIHPFSRALMSSVATIIALISIIWAIIQSLAIPNLFLPVILALAYPVVIWVFAFDENDIALFNKIRSRFLS